MAEQDRLLILEEISRKTRLPESSIRWKRHRGEMEFLFRVGKRLVAYESDVDNWIRAQRQAQRSA